MATSKTWQTRRKRVRSEAIAREVKREHDELVHGVWAKSLAGLPLAEELKVRRISPCPCRPCEARRREMQP
jgi:hypothetical protein